MLSYGILNLESFAFLTLHVLCLDYATAAFPLVVIMTIYVSPTPLDYHSDDLDEDIFQRATRRKLLTFKPILQGELVRCLRQW